MAAPVYILCILTSLLCAAMLLRAYARNRVRLLLWGGLCFVGLAASNVFLFLDIIVFPDVDLSTPRKLTALAAVLVLVCGLVLDTRE